MIILGSTGSIGVNALDICEREGIEIECLCGGSNVALLNSQIKKFKPKIILLDLQMPNMNGAEALEIIRKNDWGKDIPVMILTNLGEEEAPKTLRSLGILSYIVKAELTPRQVVDRVKKALGLS